MSFCHNEQSLHVIDDIEKLNLTHEVRDGILNHPFSFPSAKTLEGQIVRFSDRIAYINHDIDDALRSGILKKEMIPKKFSMAIGKSPIDYFVKDVIKNSSGKNQMAMSKNALGVLNGLYKFMYKNVYTSTKSKRQDVKINHILTTLFNHYLSNPDQMPGYKGEKNTKKLVVSVRDFIAGMTDRYAVNTFAKLFVPNEWE